MKDRSSVRLILCVFYAFAFVVVGVKIVELGGMVQETNNKMDALIERALSEKVTEGPAAEGSCMIQGQADAACTHLRECKMLVDNLTDDVLAKRYCLRQDANLEEDKR